MIEKALFAGLPAVLGGPPKTAKTLLAISRFLTIEGKLQNQEGVIHVKAERIDLLAL